MSNWDIIVPVGTTNLVINPSFDLNTTGYTFDGANTGARTTVGSKLGYTSCQCIYQDNLNLARYAITLTAAAHTFSVWVYLAATWDGGAVRLAMENFGGSAITTATTTTTTLATWVRLQITVTPIGGDLVGDLVVEAASAPSAGQGIFIDGIQCEALSYSTTYCDGDQGGCEWNGARQASTSTRSAQSRAGGRVYDLDTQYSFKLGQMIGVGAAPQSPDYEEHALLPGGSVSSAKTHGRVFTLQGLMLGASGSISDLHAQRQALYSVLDPEAVPYTEDGPQPVILRYRGAAVDKEISCHYEGGFQGTLNAQLCAWEGIALRFLADDPYWYQLGQTSAVLDSNDTVPLRYLAGRLRSTGQWDDLGVAADPNAGGTITAILRASDGTVYFGGNFTGFDGNAGWDYLVEYTPSTETWARVGGASDITDAVEALAEGVDGTIYIGGLFINVIDAAGDYLVQYDGTTVTSVAAGGTGPVYALAVGHDGLLYIGGNFADWGDANGDNIVSWNGAAYASLDTGRLADVYDIAVAADGTLKVAYDTDGVASWNPTTAAWAFVGGGALSDDAYAVTIDSGGRIYAGGVFLNASGNASADRIAFSDGQSWANMQTGADAAVWDLTAAPDNMIYAVGQFATIGDLTAPDRAAKWNGSAFLPLDLNLAGAGIVNTIVTGVADPVVPSNYDLWLGAADTGAAYFAGTTTIANNGTAPIYPQFVVNRAGGTSARLISLRNETTGKELAFDYSLRDGETLTVDMDPQSQTITSDFFGSRFDAYLVGGDLGTWVLQPGSNQVTCFVDVAGAPTVVAYLLWSNAYKAAD